jgi:hypothetical protein
MLECSLRSGNRRCAEALSFALECKLQIIHNQPQVGKIAVLRLSASHRHPQACTGGRAVRQRRNPRRG